MDRTLSNYDPVYDPKYDAWKLSSPPEYREVPCMACGGSGYVDCPVCNGSGRLENGEICVECLQGKVECEDCEGFGTILI